MNLPSSTQCRNYFVEYKVPQNIVQHCCKVQEVAVFLAKKLKTAGITVNIELVDRLAILHDLFKMVAIKEFGKGPHKEAHALITTEQMEFWQEMRKKYKDMYEGEVAYVIFKRDFPEFAEILRRVSNPKNNNPSWEESIVHYADWRVFQNKIVSLDERLEYLKKQYPRDDASWQKYTDMIKQQEQKIMAKLQMNPGDLRD